MLLLTLSKLDYRLKKWEEATFGPSSPRPSPLFRSAFILSFFLSRLYVLTSFLPYLLSHSLTLPHPHLPSLSLVSNSHDCVSYTIRNEGFLALWTGSSFFTPLFLFLPPPSPSSSLSILMNWDNFFFLLSSPSHFRVYRSLPTARSARCPFLHRT